MSHELTKEQWNEALKTLPDELRHYKIMNDEDIVVLSYKVQIHLLKQEVLKLQSIISSLNTSK